MRERRGILTRRDFLRNTTCTAVATLLGSSGWKEARAGSGQRASVVLVRDPDALDENHRPNGEVIQRMLDQAVQALLSVDDPVDAWRALLGRDEILGIKTNVWAYMPTPKEVEASIRRRVIEAGIDEGRVRITDREARRVLAHCTSLINVRPLRTHHWAGIGGCLKNYIMFVGLPFRYHPNACADLGHIWTLPIVKGKTRLNILVALRPLFHGRGPHHYSENYLWDYKGILVSDDPVAVDATGVRLLSAKRRVHFGEETPFPKRAHHVIYADTRHHVGVSDPSRIDLLRLGWQEDVLI